jgi:biotin carboxylase
MTKTIMILGAGEQQIPAIERAQKLGCKVACVDKNEKSPGLALVDYPFPGISTHNSDEVIAAINTLKEKGVIVSGIVAVAVEASHVVAEVGEYFNFKTVSKKAAKVSRNKKERLRCWQSAGVPCPKFGVAYDKNEAIDIANSIGYPVVFKPTTLAGAKGVVVVNSKSDAETFFKYTYSKSNSEVLIEEYIEGTEHSSESLVHNGEVFTTGFSDRNYDTKFLYPPHLLENGDTTPTNLSASIYEKTLEVVEQAIKALGINSSVAKGDIIITKDGRPIMLEMAARVSGDYFASHTASLNNGTDIISAYIQQEV